jgi:hypothetical protein
MDNLLAGVPALKRSKKTAALLTASKRKLVDAAAVIRMSPEDAQAAFMARQLVQCTLPHSNPGNVPAWTRKNGDLVLSVKPGSDEFGKTYGYPYGVIPRLLLFWMTTEALRRKDRRLDLGHSLASFMHQVGLDPSRGGNHAPNAKANFQFERVIRGWRNGAVVDLRRKK